MAVTTHFQDVADIERVLVATMRQPDADPLTAYSGDRAEALGFADIAVSVPRNRTPGTVVEPSNSPDPARQFAVASIDTLPEGAAFLAAVNADMARRPKGSRTAFVFVHGYNVQFAAGVYRAAQIRHDFNLPALAVHYSWPSKGRLSAYLYDRDSVQYARDGLVRTLDLLARSKAENIFLVGHSMGTLLTMEALRQVSLSGRRDILRRIEAVVLAAPDIDNDVFRSQLADIDPLPHPFVIFVSSRDKALRVSQRVRGGSARVGEGSDIEALRAAGLVVVDLSNVKDTGDPVRHSTFASSPSLIRIIDERDLVRTVLRQPGGENQNALQAGLGGVSDLASAIIYLPAEVTGAR